MGEKTTVYVGVGSNLGPREKCIDAAVTELRANPRIRVVAVSRVIETEPVGGPPGQGPYLNAAAQIETDLEPLALLGALKRIERLIGRREGPRWGPRPIDLDILLFGPMVLETPELTLPHPRLRERRFVLKPLSEIAPDVRDPVTGRSVRELLAQLDKKA